MSGFVLSFRRIIDVSGRVTLAVAISAALVFGRGLHLHHHSADAAAAVKSGTCTCQACPWHVSDVSAQEAPAPETPHDEQHCGVCRVLLQAADPPPAIVVADGLTPRVEVLTVASDDCGRVSLPPRCARGPPAQSHLAEILC
jgi:hypothetical protein